MARTGTLIALGLAAATVAGVLMTRKVEAAPTPVPDPNPNPNPNPTGELVVTNPGEYAQAGDLVLVQSAYFLPNAALEALPSPPGGPAGITAVWVLVQTAQPAPTDPPSGVIVGQIVTYSWTRASTGEQGIEQVQPPVQLPPFDRNLVARVTRQNPDGSQRPIARRP